MMETILNKILYKIIKIIHFLSRDFFLNAILLKHWKFFSK